MDYPDEENRTRGWSKLMAASEKGLLAQAEAEINAGADVNKADEDGWTSLHLAALNDRKTTVELLLAQTGIQPNPRNKWKSTPLILAASRGNKSLVQLLLNHPDTEINSQAEYYGRTALIEAAKNGHLELVELLLKKGADANIRDKTGRNTALIEAIKHRHETVIYSLLNSAKVDFSDKDIRLNALIWAGSAASPDVRKALDLAIEKFFEESSSPPAEE